MYKHLLKTLLVLAAMFLLVGTALAGGIVVSLDADPPIIAPGQEFTIGFTVFSMHNGQPQSGTTPEVTATNAATGETVKVTARPAGQPGHFLATLTLPSAGEWQWTIQPYGKMVANFPAQSFTPITVRATTPALSPANSLALPLTLIVLTAVLGLAWLVGRSAMARAAKVTAQ